MIYSYVFILSYTFLILFYLILLENVLFLKQRIVNKIFPITIPCLESMGSGSSMVFFNRILKVAGT